MAPVTSHCSDVGIICACDEKSNTLALRGVIKSDERKANKGLKLPVGEQQTVLAGCKLRNERLLRD